MSQKLRERINKDLQYHESQALECGQDGTDFSKGRGCGIRELAFDIRNAIFAHVLASTEPLGEITKCQKCDGSGRNAHGDCCRIPGHAGECACVLCQWKNAYYRNENEANDLRAQLQAAVHERKEWNSELEQKHVELSNSFIKLNQENKRLQQLAAERGREPERLRAALVCALKTLDVIAYETSLESNISRENWQHVFGLAWAGRNKARESLGATPDYCDTDDTARWLKAEKS